MLIGRWLQKQVQRGVGDEDKGQRRQPLEVWVGVGEVSLREPSTLGSSFQFRASQRVLTWKFEVCIHRLGPTKENKKKVEETCMEASQGLGHNLRSPNANVSGSESNRRGQYRWVNIRVSTGIWVFPAADSTCCLTGWHSL